MLLNINERLPTQKMRFKTKFKALHTIKTTRTHPYLADNKKKNT